MIQGIKQTQQGKEMQKNLGARVNYEIPEAAKQALALAQRQAGSDMPYQKSMQNAMDLQMAKSLGGATRAATSSQDLLGMMTNLGEKGLEQQQDIGMAAGQRYDAMQAALQNSLGTMASYQEKQRADQQQNWYEKAQAAAAMRGAGMQNTMGGLMGFGQAAGSFLATPEAQKMFTKKTTPSASLTAGENISPNELEGPAGYVAPPSFDPAAITGMNSNGGWNYNQPQAPVWYANPSPMMPMPYNPMWGGNNTSKNPGMWEDAQYGGYNTAPRPAANRLNSGLYNIDLFNPVY